jgi:hypothetical protein
MHCLLFWVRAWAFFPVGFLILAHFFFEGGPMGCLATGQKQTRKKYLYIFCLV